MSVRGDLRAFRRAPVAGVLAALSLAVSIGANTTAFSLIDALLLRPLRVPRPHELVAVSAVPTGSAADPDGRLPPAAWDAFARDGRVFSAAIAWQGDYPVVNVGAGAEHGPATLARVGGDYFEALGVRPRLGRLFGPGEREPVAVLDYRFWQRRFASDPGVLGASILVDGVARTIVGVTPESFTGLELEVAPDVTVPMPSPPPPRFAMAARLRPGVTAETAAQRLQALWSALPGSDPARVVRVRSIERGVSFLRERQSRPLLILMALAAGVLLVACLNVANLLIARSAARRHEIAIRVALGAGRWPILRRLLAESLVLAGAGGALGLAFAGFAGRWLVDLTWTGVVPTAIDPAPDFRVVAFTLALSIAAGIVLPLLPARSVLRIGPADALRSSGRGFAGQASRVERALVSAQVALCLVLLSGAILLVRSLQNLRSADLGFRRDGVLMVRLFPLNPRDPIPDRLSYCRDLFDRLRRLRGVESVSASSMGPVALADFLQPVAADGVELRATLEYAAPDFFHTLRMRLLAGREFSWTDRETTPPVAIVSESLARRLFGAADPLGRAVTVQGRPRAIVGVVNSASLWTLRAHEPAAVYLPLMQDPSLSSFWIEVRAAGDAAQLAPAVRRTLDGLGRHTALRIGTLEGRVDEILVHERTAGALAAFLAGLSVLLAAVGMYGLTWHTITRRAPEFGLRMAVGARPADILRLVVSGILKLVGIGAIAGAPAAFWASRLLAGFAPGVSALDPVVLTAPIAILAAAGVLAACLPARRAARTDPMLAIRAE